MKNLFLSILFNITVGIGCLYAQLDTLHSVYEFSSPTANPWGLCWDGSNFWISDHHSGMIYKSNSNGQTLGSIQINNAQITGINFVNDTLWCLNANVIGDTIINNITWPLYSLYQINKLN
jgi:hypothetical protein